jgi:hypothetical protein
MYGFYSQACKFNCLVKAGAGPPPRAPRHSLIKLEKPDKLIIRPTKVARVHVNYSEQLAANVFLQRPCYGDRIKGLQRPIWPHAGGKLSG